MSMTIEAIYKIFIPIQSMYRIFTYIWFVFMVNIGKYTIHGCYGIQQNYSGNEIITQVKVNTENNDLDLYV